MASEPQPQASDDAAEEALVDIGEACRVTGLSARTVRYYEELGLLPGVRRRSSGRRVYGNDELERLSFIGRLKKLGLSLAEIKELNAVYGIGGSTHDMLRLLDGHLGQHVEALDSRIEELVVLRDEMKHYRSHIGTRVAMLAAAGEDSQ
ncbi:MAG: MerR family copper efflux transcriptional regulator [Myxococcota bacterium]|jgi:MerR family copper efflux transcriptional regulator